MEHRDTGVALKDFRMRPDQLVVKKREKLVRVVTANSSQHDRDLVVLERQMKILNACVRGSRRPTLVATRARHHPHLQTKRLQVPRGLLNTAGPPSHRPERRRNNGNRVSDLNTRRSLQTLHGSKPSVPSPPIRFAPTELAEPVRSSCTH